MPGVRAGARALSLLAAPLNVHLLEALEEEPMSLVDLRRAVGSPPQTTVRSHLQALGALGILVRRHQDGLPASSSYELTEPGRELLAVADVLRRWLAAAPEGPLQLGSVAARSAIKALADGWSSAIVRALAARPFSLTELDRLIPGLSYPALERRLAAMRLAGQIGALTGAGRGTPYAVTDWTRCSIGPLATAAGWEQRHLAAGAQPIGRIDVESYFLLTVPLMELGAEVSGTCRLAVDVDPVDGQTNYAGALVRVEQGSLVSCVSRLQGEVDGWVLGTAQSWIGALIELAPEGIELGGDQELAAAFLEALQRIASGVKQRA